MNWRARNTGTLLPALAVALAVSVGVKTHGENVQAPSAGDARQGNAQDRSSDVDRPQPARPSRSASVTASAIPDGADGKSLSIAPATGRDRCDRTVSSTPPSFCGQRIEGKAGQFTAPGSATVAPETRVLLLTNPRTFGAGTRLDSAFDGPNGPSEQLAGALREGKAGQDLLVPTPNGSAPGAPPSNILPIIVTPPK